MAFTITNSYLQNVYEGVCKKNAHEPELAPFRLVYFPVDVEPMGS